MQDFDKHRLIARTQAACVLALVACAPVVALAQATGEVSAAEGAATQADADRRFDVQEYIVRGNTVLDARAIEKAVTPYMGPQRTLKDLEGARDALLAAYQAQGYQSVYVDVPEQSGANGVIVMLVSETKVGRVRVVGAKYGSPLAVRDQVPALQEGKVPDFTQAQAELTAINRTGQRQVMPLVKQGTLPGTMDVDLKVEDKSPWQGSLGLNNDYSPDTSELRALASIGHNNLWQRGHSASISYYVAPEDPAETNVWSASYLAPIAGSNWAVEASGYISDSDVATVGGATVLGKGHAIGLKTTYTVPTSGAWWHSISAGVDFKDSREKLTMAGGGDFVPLKYAPITLAYSGFVQGESTQVALGMSAVAGTRSFFGYGSDWEQFGYKRFKASPSFLAIKADLNGTYTFKSDWQIGARLAGQVTDSPLVSSEQMAAGGMNSVRGYLSAEVTGDIGAVGSLELRTPALPWFASLVESWRFYLFADAAELHLRDALPEQDRRFTLLSTGVGASWRLLEHVSGRLDFGYPLKSSIRTQADDPQLNFTLNASY